MKVFAVIFLLMAALLALCEAQGYGRGYGNQLGYGGGQMGYGGGQMGYGGRGMGYGGGRPRSSFQMMGGRGGMYRG